MLRIELWTLRYAQAKRLLHPHSDLAYRHRLDRFGNGVVLVRGPAVGRGIVAQRKS